MNKAQQIDVAIIGAGPAGLSASIELKRLGIKRVVVLERENEAGGIPRHCGDFPFGMREYGRVLTGTKYAKKLVKSAKNAGVEIWLSTSVVEMRRGGHLLLVTNEGTKEISASRIIYACGVREKTRSARLISGDRVQGVLNTGALQQMVYLRNQKPFENPVIIGSELVAFSAIRTCSHAKIKPVAIIEEADKVIARWPVELYAPLMQIPLHRSSKLIKIIGSNKVSAVEIKKSNGQIKTIKCDGVILCGHFIPESSLARLGHLEIDPATNGPIIDQFGRCSDPVYYAAGNILRPVETAGWCWNEGKQIANWVALDLASKLQSRHILTKIEVSKNVKLAVPQCLTGIKENIGMSHIQLRFDRLMKGKLILSNDDEVIYSRNLSVFPQRRILISLSDIKDLATIKENSPIKVEFIEA